MQTQQHIKYNTTQTKKHIPEPAACDSALGVEATSGTVGITRAVVFFSVE